MMVGCWFVLLGVVYPSGNTAVRFRIRSLTSDFITGIGSLSLRRDV